MKINIYIACHKQVQVLNDDIFHPVQVGTALKKDCFEQYLHDNTEDNISEKNQMYCELTAQYWAWKNEDADYYGLMHYRRYFSFDETKKEPYVQYDGMHAALAENKYDSAHIEQIVADTDFIMPVGEKMSETVYDQYKKSANHNIEDLDIVLQIIKEKYPEYQQVAETYMNSKVQYFCNMFIMKKELFHRYCAWLFDILEEHERRSSFADYNQEEYRVSGFLAERLLGIFYTHIKLHTDMVCKELSRIHFEPAAVQLPIEKPVNDKSVVPVVFAVNDAFVPYLAVTIQSLLDNGEKDNFYHLIVLHAGATEEMNRAKLQQIIKEYENCYVDFYDVSAFLYNNKFFVDKHLSVETYFRLFIPDIVPFYDKVVYLDCDLVLQHDVAELFNLDLHGYYLAAAKDLDYIGQFKIDKDRRQYTANVLEMKNGLEYFQAGVLVLNLAEFRAKYSVEQLIEIALSKKWQFHDQDVLNYICQGKVLFLPQQWNTVMNWKNDTIERMTILKQAPLQLYQEYVNARKNPYIVHYAGYQKPWNSATCDYDYIFWQYARKTAFYENILLADNSIASKKNKAGIVQSVLKNKALLNRLFPPGTKRRMLAKKVRRLIKI